MVRGQTRFDQRRIRGRQRNFVQFQDPANEMLPLGHCHPGNFFDDFETGGAAIQPTPKSF
jgi:hypothetical protein